MDVILWRHADAEQGLPDDARRLTAKGKKQALKVASWLKTRIEAPVTVLSSPAARAVETAEVLGKPPRVEPALSPGATPARVLQTAGWPSGAGTVVVVGHQPDLGRTAALLLFGQERDISVKKGAAWWFREKGGEVVLLATITPDLT